MKTTNKPNSSSNIPPKPSPGRPRDRADEVKKKRQYSLTTAAHEGIYKLARKLGMQSRSELIEAIGREEVNLNIPESSDINAKVIPLLPRLQAVMKEPVSRFRSTLSLARILAYKLDLTKDINDFYKNEELIVETVTSAFTILALEDYLYHDEYLRDVSSSLQWLVYKILSAKAGFKEKSPEKKEIIQLYSQHSTDDNYLFSTDQFNPTICQIYNSMRIVRELYPLHYQILYLRAMQGMSYPLVCKILRLRDINISEESAYYHFRKAIQALRQIWHQLHEADEGMHINTSEAAEFLEELRKPLSEAQRFYYLTKEGDNEKLLGYDNSVYRQQLELSLIGAMFDPTTSILFAEVLHAREHDFVPKANKTNDEYNQYQLTATEAINKKLIGAIRENLNVLKAKVRICGLRNEDFREVLMEVASSVAGADIPARFLYRKHKELEIVLCSKGLLGDACNLESYL